MTKRLLIDWMIYYFKNAQSNDLWQYYKVITDRRPPGCEVVNFLNQQPLIEFREYHLHDPESRQEYHAFWRFGIPIPQSEYEAAYQRATAVPFNLLINGRWSGHTPDVLVTNDSGKSNDPSFLVRCYRRLIALVIRADYQQK